MKKFLYVLCMVGIASAGLLAQETEAELFNISLDGDAAVRWGIDLDNDMSSGFQNKTTADATLLLVGDISRESEGEGWWGEFEVKMEALNIGSTSVLTLASDASLEDYDADDFDYVEDGVLYNSDDVAIGYINDDGDAVFYQYFSKNDDGEIYTETDAITGEIVVEVARARITNGTLYIDILKPDPSINFAEDFALEYLGKDDPRSNFTVSTFDDVWQGMAAGIDLDGVVENVEIQFYSFDDWEEINWDYGTAAIVKLAAVPEMLDVDLAVFFDGLMGTEGRKIGFGVKPALSIADLGLDFTVGVDGEYNITTEVFGLETSADLNYQIIEQLGISAAAYTTYNTSGADVNLPLDVKFGVDVDVAPVAVGVETHLLDLLDTNKVDDGFFWAVAADASVAMNGITFAVNYGVERNRGNVVDPDTGIEISSKSDYGTSWQGRVNIKDTAGASIAMDEEFHGIDNTTFTLGWSDFEWVGESLTKGVLTLETKIAF